MRSLKTERYMTQLKNTMSKASSSRSDIAPGDAGWFFQLHCAICSELTASHFQKCTNIVSVQIPPPNLPVCPSIPVEFSTLKKRWHVCVQLVECRRMHMNREGAGGEHERSRMWHLVSSFTALFQRETKGDSPKQMTFGFPYLLLCSSRKPMTAHLKR